MRSIALIAIFALAPALAEARPNTWEMTCAQAAGMVASNGAAVLQTKPRRYDRYLASPWACSPAGKEGVAQFAPTLDNPRCHIGFLCKEPLFDLRGGFVRGR